MRTSVSIVLDGTDCGDRVKAERSYGTSVKIMIGESITGHIRLHLAKQLRDDLTRIIDKIEQEDDLDLYPTF